MALFTTFYPTLQVPPSGPVSEGVNAGYFVYGPWDHVYRAFVPWVLATSKFTDTGPNTQTYTRPTDQTIAAPYQQYLVRYVTPPLKAQTLGGTIDLVLGLRQTNADMQYRYRVVVWVSKGAAMAYDARGLALDYTDPPGRTFPLVSSGWGLAAPQPLAPVVILDGDHLVVEIGAVVETPLVAGAPARQVQILYASMTGPPPAGVPYPDLVVGSTATSDHAGSVTFSQPLSVADAPANDSCAAAIVIPALPYDSGFINVERATYDPATDLPSSCQNAVGEGLYNTIWWRWTATATGTIRLEGVSAGDTTLTAYTGSCGALTEVACRVGYNGSEPLHHLPVTLGTTYYFRLGCRFQLDGASHSIKARWITPAYNDHFADRIVIPSLPFTHAVDMSLATFEAGEPQNPNAWTYVDPADGQSVWYEWTADAAPGNIRVNTMGSLTASMVTIWTGPWGAMTEVFSAPWTNTAEVDADGYDFNGYYDQANCVFRPTPGVTYYISILTAKGDYWNNYGGDLTTVTVSRALPVPPNETCATALTIPAIPYYAVHDFTNAADAMEAVPLGACDWFTMEDNDSGKALWFKWTADRSGPMNFNTFGAPPDGGPYTEVIIYTGTCGGLVPLVCDGLNLDTWQTQIIFTAVQGTTYYWRIDSQARIEGKVYVFLDQDYDSFFDGDVVVGCDSIYLFAASGAFRHQAFVQNQAIPTASGTDPETGLLYQALFVGNKVLRMNGRLETLGQIDTLPGITPEVPGFFDDGRLFVGHWGDRATWGIEGLVDPTFAIRQFDPDTGALMGVHAAEQEFTGSAWVDPAADQRTLVYTSHGRRMLRFDVVDSVQGPDFMRVPGEFPTYEARGLRQRPTGEYLLADRTEVKRLSADGTTVLQAYPVPSHGRPGWEGPEGPYLDDLNVIDQSPDAKSFWIGDQDSTEVQQIDVATGALLLRIPGGPFGLFGFHSGAGQLCGLSVIGGFRAGTPSRTPPPVVACLDIFPLLPACALDLYPLLPDSGAATFPVLPESDCMDASTFVVNMALQEVGISKPITDLVNDPSQEALCARLVFMDVVDTVLRDHPWKFATEYAVLVWLQGSPAVPVNPDWTYTYSLPDDCVRVRRVCEPSQQRRYSVTPIPFDQRATPDGAKDTLLCNEPGGGQLEVTTPPTITIEYTKRLACPTQVNDAQFREAVVYKLAARLAKALARDSKDADRCLRNYSLALPKGQTQHANSQQVQRPVDEPPDWLKGR